MYKVAITLLPNGYWVSHDSEIAKHKGNTLPEIKKVIFNPPATIVFWLDGTKTVVKCKEGEEFSEWAELP